MPIDDCYRYQTGEFGSNSYQNDNAPAARCHDDSAHGTVSVNKGVITYTPEQGYTGPDSFKYTISDGTLTQIGVVNVMVYETGQWASAVATASSQASAGEGNANGARGAPDWFADEGNAWSPSGGGQMEFIELDFDQAVLATGLLIGQTGSGALTEVHLWDGMQYVTIWSSAISANHAGAFEWLLEFAETEDPIESVRLVYDASAGGVAIDAVRLLTGGSALTTTLTSRSLAGGGYYVEASYDSEDRVLEENTYSFSTLVGTVEYEYDATEGWLSAVNETDALNRTTRTEFNEDGLTTAKELAYDTGNAARTEYTYNEDGNMTLLEDPLQNQTSWEYDSVGREIEMTDPLNNTVYKTYDDDGLLASILSRNNLLRTFAYDEEGRVETEKWYDGPSDTDPVVQTYSWSYDEQGRLQTAGNDVGDYTFKYDHTGLLTEVENPFGVVLYFKYDDRGFRTLVEDSFGGSVASDYSDAGQLLSRLYTATNQPTLRIDLEYDDLGRVIGQTRYSNAAGTTVVATSDFSYDESGRLDSLEHRNASEQLIADYVWDWDAVGQLISQTDHGVTREYDYDEQGQLISEDIDQNLTEWDYDTNGNRNTTGYTVGTGNRILSDGIWDYTYDDEGNMTEKDEINGDLRWTYGYDHANQLVEVKSYDGQSLLDEILFRYDVFGNRVEKEVNPAPVGPSELIERYVYDGWNPLKPTPIGNENWDVVIEINDMGSLTRRYLRGDVVDELFARIEGTTDALWLLGDHLGSIRDVIDDSGNPVKSVEYDAWGNIISQTGTGELGRYTFTSREWDVETQLQYNRARYYDPTLGRWVTQDPLGFEAGDSNLYRYVNNKPTVATDPSGYQLRRQFIPRGKFDRIVDIAPNEKVFVSTSNVYRLFKGKELQVELSDGMLLIYQGAKAKNVRWVQFVHFVVGDLFESKGKVQLAEIVTDIEAPNKRKTQSKGVELFHLDTIGISPYYHDPKNPLKSGTGGVSEKQSIMFDTPFGVASNAKRIFANRQTVYGGKKESFLGTLVLMVSDSYAVDTKTNKVLAHVRWQAHAGLLTTQGKQKLKQIRMLGAANWQFDGDMYLQFKDADKGMIDGFGGFLKDQNKVLQEEFKDAKKLIGD